MEAGSVPFEEHLHQGNLQDTFVIIHHSVVPHASAALFYCSCYQVYVDAMIADVGHQLDQNHLIDAGEHLGFQQIDYLQLHESLRQLQLGFHILSD